MASQLIQNATVISMDPTIGVKRNFDILIKNGIIEDVGANLSTKAKADNIIDGTHCIVAPGFVDTHHHLWQQLIRGVTTDWSLADYAIHIRNIYGSL